jgi:hypothetical protein
MRCSYRDCYYNDPKHVANDRAFLTFKSCDKCDQMAYHTEACRRVMPLSLKDDWDKYHRSGCGGQPPGKRGPGLPREGPGEQMQPAFGKIEEKVTLDSFERTDAKELGRFGFA